MLLLLMNVLITFGICSTPKKSKYVTSHYLSHKKQSNEFQYQSTHQDLLHKPHPLFHRNCVQVDYL